MPKTETSRQKAKYARMMAEIRLLGDAIEDPVALQADIANQKAQIAINRMNQRVYGDKKSK